MELTGRVTLFHSKDTSGSNAPMYSGFIEYEDGTRQSLRLWHKDTPRATGGEMWTGQVRPEVI